MEGCGVVSSGSWLGQLVCCWEDCDDPSCSIKVRNFLTGWECISFSRVSRSPMWSPSFRFPQQNPITFQFSSTQVTSLDHLMLLDLITLVTSDKKCKSQSPFTRYFLQPPVTSSLLRSVIFLNTIFLNNLSLHSSLMDRYQLLQNQEHCRYRQCSMSKKMTLFYKVNFQYNKKYLKWKSQMF